MAMSSRRSRSQSGSRRNEVFRGLRPAMEVLANYDITALQDLVEDLIDHSDGEFFAYAVTQKVAPDYFQFVKKPMDLNKINNNLRQMKYMSNKEVIADIEQMFENCFLYNETETEVYKAGIRLKKYFEKVALEFGLMAPEKTKTPMDEGPDMKFEISQPEINHSQPLEIEESRHENDLPSNFEQVSGEFDLMSLQEDIDARAEKSHPQASMNENFTILKSSQPEIIHPQPSEIVENRPEHDLPSNFEQVTGEFDLMSPEKSPSLKENTSREYELPYGWKKVVSRKYGYKRVTILSPTGKCFDRPEGIKKFVKKHPEIEYDAKLTNFSLPLELRKKELRNCNICNGKYDWRGFWLHKQACQKKNAGKTETNEDDENNIPSILTGSEPEQDPQPEMSNPQPSKVEEKEAKKKYDPSKQGKEPPKKPMDETAIPEINHSQSSEMKVNRHEHELMSNYGASGSPEENSSKDPKKPMEEAIDIPQVEMSHLQSSKVVEIPREFDLPFGWKKIAYKKKRNGLWFVTITSPNGKYFNSFKDIKNFVLKHPEMKFDAKLTNFSLPLELRKVKAEMSHPQPSKVEEKKAKKKYDSSKQGQEPPKKPMDETAIPKISQPEINHSQSSEMEVIRHEHDLTSNYGASGSAEENSSKDPKKPMEEAIDIPQAEMSHSQPSKIKGNHHEFDLPFGWKKIAYKTKSKNRKWIIKIKSPYEKLFNSNKEIRNYVKQHPKVEYDSNVTNFSLPPELRVGNEYRNCNICNGEYHWRALWQHKQACQKKNAGKTETNEEDENNIPSILTGSKPGQDPQAEMSNSQPSKVEEKEAKKKYDPSEQGQEPPKKPIDEIAIPEILQPEINHSQPSEIEVNRHEHDLMSSYGASGSAEENSSKDPKKPMEEAIDIPQAEMSHTQPSKVEEKKAKKKYDPSKQRQEPPKKPMDENVIPQVERTHPGPSKIEENRLEFNLPFGWKKIVIRSQKRGNTGKCNVRMGTPNGNMLKNDKEIENFLKEHPEVGYDVKFTNTSLPPSLFFKDDYDFICDFCGKGFFRSLDNKEFKTHMCNYCPHCPEIFIQKEDRDDHIQKNHLIFMNEVY